MKKLYYLGAMAGLILTSCANDDLVNDPGTNSVPNDGAIAFNLRLNNQTRANLETVMDNFGVFAVKANGDSDPVWAKDNLIPTDLTQMDPQIVMNNYKVLYDPNVVRHGSNWYYEGLNGMSNTETQYLKYWDGKYTNTYFFAYGPFDKAPKFAAGGEKDPTLTWAGIKTTTDAREAMVYADVTKSVNANYIKDYAAGATTPEGTPNPTTPGALDHNDPLRVPLTFHHGMSQLRIAFHENIPGYTVEMAELTFNGQTGTHGVVGIPADYDKTATPKWKKGYYVNEGDAVVTYDAANGFAASLAYENVKTSQDFFDFDVPTGVIEGVNHTNATPSPTVYNVIPNTGDYKDADNNPVDKNSGIQFVMNYTLKSEDTAETIEVKGARVYVDPKYTAWEANTVYTYVFLITRNSSGSTTGPDPDPKPDDPKDALYPIIFDKVEIANFDNPNEESEWIVNGLQISADAVTLAPEGTFTLTSSLNNLPTQNCPNVNKVEWTSTAPAVATVNDGVITAVGAGTTTITCTVYEHYDDNGTTDDTSDDTCTAKYFASCEVTVVGVTIEGAPTAALTVGGTANLSAALANWTGATLTWATSNEAAATVDNNGKVTAVAVGNANITVTAVKNGLTTSASVAVEVVAAP